MIRLKGYKWKKYYQISLKVGVPSEAEPFQVQSFKFCEGKNKSFQTAQ